MSGRLFSGFVRQGCVGVVNRIHFVFGLWIRPGRRAFSLAVFQVRAHETLEEPTT